MHELVVRLAKYSMLTTYSQQLSKLLTLLLYESISNKSPKQGIILKYRVLAHKIASNNDPIL
jgi:hypothetical protein